MPASCSGSDGRIVGVDFAVVPKLSTAIACSASIEPTDAHTRVSAVACRSGR